MRDQALISLPRHYQQLSTAEWVAADCDLYRCSSWRDVGSTATSWPYSLWLYVVCRHLYSCRCRCNTSFCYFSLPPRLPITPFQTPLHLSRPHWLTWITFHPRYITEYAAAAELLRHLCNSTHRPKVVLSVYPPIHSNTVWKCFLYNSLQGILRTVCAEKWKCKTVKWRTR